MVVKIASINTSNNNLVLQLMDSKGRIQKEVVLSFSAPPKK